MEITIVQRQITKHMILKGCFKGALSAILGSMIGILATESLAAAVAVWDS